MARHKPPTIPDARLENPARHLGPASYTVRPTRIRCFTAGRVSRLASKTTLTLITADRALRRRSSIPTLLGITPGPVWELSSVSCGCAAGLECDLTGWAISQGVRAR
jgi:hypothetical protein